MISLNLFLDYKNIRQNEVIKKQYQIGLIHKIFLNILKNSRNYLASTKTKGEVRGGGRKPWKQKGTGRARAGSIRSPLWKGGGIIFGPKPRKVYKKINKKELFLARKFLLLLKKKYIKSFIINNSNIQNLRAKSIKLFIENSLNLKFSNKILFLFFNKYPSFIKAIKNFNTITTSYIENISISKILKADSIIIFI